MANGVQVRELNPAWMSTQGYYGLHAGAYSSYPASSTGSGSSADIPQYRTVHKDGTA